MSTASNAVMDCSEAAERERKLRAIGDAAIIAAAALQAKEDVALRNASNQLHAARAVLQNAIHRECLSASVRAMLTEADDHVKRAISGVRFPAGAPDEVAFWCHCKLRCNNHLYTEDEVDQLLCSDCAGVSGSGCFGCAGACDGVNCEL